MSSQSISKGLGYVKDAAGAIGQHPIRYAALVIALAVIDVVSPLWGIVPAFMGWLDGRKRIVGEGFVALGEVLAPQRARLAYKDGVWRGLWRVHGLSIAFFLVQLPVVALALSPAAIAYHLLQFAAAVMPNPTLAMIIGTGLPALVLLCCVAIAAGQTMLALRVLASMEPPQPLGTVFHVVGATWRAALRDFATLIALGIALAIIAAIGGGIVYGLGELAGALELGLAGTLLLLTWTGFPVVLFLVALTLDSIIRWAEQADPSPVGEGTFSFGEWLKSWLALAFGGLGDHGVVTVATALFLTIGVVIGTVALLTGQVFQSWIGMAWFAVTAAVLITLQIKGRKA